jgi:hypothetical protein
MGKTRQVPDKFSIVRSVQERGTIPSVFSICIFRFVFVFLSDFGVWGMIWAGSTALVFFFCKMARFPKDNRFGMCFTLILANQQQSK